MQYVRKFDWGACGVLLLAMLVPSGAGAAEPPWERQFLEAPGSEVAAAAKLLPPAPNSAVVVLFEEKVATFTGEGRLQTRHRRAYQVTSPQGVQSWADFGVGWTTWREGRPRLRARVIGPGGRVHLLDEKTIEDSGVRSPDPALYTDQRLLRAPLPALEVGAVVEEEVVSDEGPLVAGAGHAARWTWGSSVPIRKSRLVIDAPANLEVHLAQRPYLLAPVIERSNGRVRMILERGPLEARSAPELYLPDDHQEAPYVTFGTARSWADLAQRYHALVEKRLAAADVGAVAREVVGKEREPLAVIRRLLARVHRDVRYTGVELGAAAIEPAAPAEVLKRGYGDCKDKATLLVALLRAAGLKAQVALLQAGIGADVEPGVPGLEFFNHVIVHVPGPRPLWVDATARYAPVGEMPIPDQGRRALVIAPGSKAPVLTPRVDQQGSRVVETVTVHLAEEGPARITERHEYSGAAGRDVRGAFAERDRKDTDQLLERSVKSRYLAPKVTRWQSGDPLDVSQPFWLEVEAAEAALGETESDVARVALRSGAVFERLPPDLLEIDGDKQPGDKRLGPFQLYEPHSYELRYLLVPPHGFVADPLPAARAEDWGPIRYSQRVSARPDRSVEAVIRVEAQRRRLTATEYEALRAKIRKFLSSNAEPVTFRNEGAVALAAQRLPEAIRAFRRLEAEHPGQARHSIQLANALLQVGLGDHARREARMATERAPRSSFAWCALGQVLEHDRLGREPSAGWDLAGAEAAYRKALALDPKDRCASIRLAMLYGRGEDGSFNAPAARAAVAEPMWRRLVEEQGVEALRANWLLSLYQQGKVTEVVKRGSGVQLPNIAHTIVLASMALTPGGVPAAMEAARNRIAVTDERRVAIVRAAQELINRRKYAAGAGLMQAVMREQGVTPPPVFEKLAALKPAEQQPRAPADPVWVVRALMAGLVAPGPDLKARLAPHATSELIATLVRPEGRHQLLKGLRQLDRWMLEVTDVALADLLWNARTEVHGDARTGYLVSLEGSGESRRLLFLVAARREGLRVLAISPRLEVLEEARRLVRAGDLEAGIRWLGYLGVLRNHTFAPAAELRTQSFTGDRPRDATEFAHETAMAQFWLNPQARLPAQVAATLEDCLQRGGAESSARCARALYLSTHEHEPATQALALLERVRAKLGADYQNYRANLLIELGRYPEVREALLARQAAGNAFEQRDVAEALSHGGDLDAAEAIYRRLIANPDGFEFIDLNQLAWFRLLRRDAGDATLAWAERAVELNKMLSTHSYHTLASVLAERGEVVKARQALLEAIDRHPDGQPLPRDHYVLGRIAEACGLREIAVEEYRQVERPKFMATITAWRLAKQRLDLLAKP